MTLIEMIARGDDLTRPRVVIESFPSCATRSTARRTGLAPDLSIVVQLIKLSARGDDGAGPWIVVQLLPART